LLSLPEKGRCLVMICYVCCSGRCGPSARPPGDAERWAATSRRCKPMAKTPLTKRVSTAADVGIGATLLTIATAFSIPGAFGQGSPAGARIGLGLVGGTLYAIGGHLYRRGKKATAVPAEQILKSDPRPPVVYLRSFRDDSATALVPNSSVSTLFSVTRTEEQQIAEVFGELGPFIAIGRPGESLPELGAARMHVANEQWQETVADLMKRARLVLYRASDTQGFKWEVQRGGELLGPTRMAFLIPSHGSLLLLDPE
jgi:hypothetical protein